MDAVFTFQKFQNPTLYSNIWREYQKKTEYTIFSEYDYNDCDNKSLTGAILEVAKG